MLNGKPTRRSTRPASHIFAIPAAGVSGPARGCRRRREEPLRRGAVLAEPDHETISFTFRTGKPGYYRWQCLVPCAAGFILGFGGPMATTGYMDGFIQVV